MTARVSGLIEHEIGTAGLLAIRLHTGEIRLHGVDGTVARIHDETGSLEGAATIERGSGSLSLRADRGVSIGIGSIGFAVGRHVGDLDIDVPFGATVVVESASGGVVVDGLTGDQRYRTASGDLELHGVSGRLTIESMSGDVEVRTAGASAIVARTVSGDLSVRGDADVPSARIATTSGEIRLEGRFAGTGPYTVDTVSGDTIIAPTGGLQLEVKTVTGDIHSELPSTSAGSRGLRTLIVGHGGPTVAFRSISGDVRIVAHRAGGEASEAKLAPIVAEPPIAPIAPEPPEPPHAPQPPHAPLAGLEPEAPTELVVTDPSLVILEALERGEIDVAEASRRLAVLDGAGESGAPA